MSLQIEHLVVGLPVVAGAAGWLRHLQRKRPKAEVTEGATESSAWNDVKLGIALIQKSLLRLELSVAMLPTLREDVDRHDAEIRSLRNDSHAIRADILDIRREADDRDAKIIRLAREIRDGD